MKRVVPWLLSLSLMISCWKKQQHEITAPETPVYSLNGVSRDIDSHEAMAGVVVELRPIEMLYDVDFTGALDTTDAHGRYQFDDITPGHYQLLGYRQAYAVVDVEVIVEHHDKSFDIALPQALVSRISYRPPQYPLFRGICFKDAANFAGTSSWKDNPDDRAQEVVMVGDFNSHFTRVGSSRYTIDNPPFYALAYLNRFWTTDRENTVYSIDPARGNVDGRTVIDHVIRDLTSDRKNLWATTELGKIVKFGSHPSTIVAIYDVSAAQPYGIAWSGENIWITDYSANLVLQLDDDMQVARSYRPFSWSESDGVHIVGNFLNATFDFSGHFWANDGITVYKFTL